MADYVRLVKGHIRAEVLSRGAHFALVSYSLLGNDYEIYLSDDEYYEEGEADGDTQD